VSNSGDNRRHFMAPDKKGRTSLRLSNPAAERADGSSLTTCRRIFTSIYRHGGVFPRKGLCW
jgi:hypothetical protein